MPRVKGESRSKPQIKARDNSSQNAWDKYIKLEGVSS